MSTTVVKRILWKERRTQRSFWLGILGLGVALQLLVTVWISLLGGRNLPSPVLLNGDIAFFLSCCFATGSAAIAFAGETESKTKGLLQGIGVRPGELLAGKLALSVIGSYLLLAFLCATGGLIVVGTFRPATLTESDTSQITLELSSMATFVLGPVVFVAVGTFFSLVSSDVLITVLLAGLTTAGLLTIPSIGERIEFHAALIVLLVICDRLLARRWLRDAPAVRWPHVLPRLARVEHAAESRTPIESARSPVAWRRCAESLFWKEWRQGAPIAAQLFGLGLLALGVCLLFERLTKSLRGVGLFPLTLVFFLPLILGVAAVRADRRNGAFRLLAERGIVVEGYWLCKQLVWMPLTLLVSFILLTLDKSFLAFRTDQGPSMSLWNFAKEMTSDRFRALPIAFDDISINATISVAAVHILLLYSVGYFMASLLRGVLLSFFSGLFLWLAIALWWGLVTTFGVPFGWTVGVVPLILLAASWARTGDWLLRRNRISAWAKVAGVLIVPLFVVFIATIIFRVTEIPAIAVPIEAANSAFPVAPHAERSEKLSLYVQALQAISPKQADERKHAAREHWISEGWKYATAAEKKWLAENTRARDLALKAAAAKEGPAQTKDMDTPGPIRLEQAALLQDRVNWLRLVLLASGRLFEAEDRLDEALDCYLAAAQMGNDLVRMTQGTVGDLAGNLFAMNYLRDWAGHRKQSIDRVVRALRQFERLERSSVPVPVRVIWAWEQQRRADHDLIWGGSRKSSSSRSVAELWIMRWLLPWELFRLERLEDAVFANDLTTFQLVDRDLRQQGFVDFQQIHLWDKAHESLSRLERTTASPPFDSHVLIWSDPSYYVDSVARERMRLITVAIADFMRTHRKPPSTLAELVPAYFARLPLDPWNGRALLYEPNGVNVRVDSGSGRLDAGKPFLASGGKMDARFVQKYNSLTQRSALRVVRRLACDDRYIEKPPRDLHNGQPVTVEFPGPLVALP